MKRVRSISSVILIICLLPGSTSLGWSCTCWSVAGDRVAGGGTLIAKNRDFVPGPSRVKLEVPPEGFRFVGLIPEMQGLGVVAGTNEKGLTVVTMTAGTVPRDLRLKHGRGLNRAILTGYGSVDAVLGDWTIFSGGRPAFYLLADGKKTAVVEVAMGGGTSIDVTENGNLFHTNHYVSSVLPEANIKPPGESSLERLKRIRELVLNHQGTFSRDDFIAFSRNREGAPDNRIWRTGPKTRTLATWIVATPAEGSPALFVRTANPGEPEECYSMVLDASFWKSGRIEPVACPLPGDDPAPKSSPVYSPPPGGADGAAAPVGGGCLMDACERERGGSARPYAGGPSSS